MSKPTKLPQLVEPAPVPFTREEDAASRLTGRGGLSEAQARWVAKLLVAPDLLPAPTEGSAPLEAGQEYLISRFCEELERPDRNLTMLLLLQMGDLVRMHGQDLNDADTPGTAAARITDRFVRVFEQHKLPVQQTLMSRWSEFDQPVGLVRVLRAHGLFDPIALLDLEVIRRFGDEPGFIPPSISHGDARFTHACNLTFWLRGLGASALSGLVPILAAEKDDESAARLARGIARAVSEHFVVDLQRHQEWFDRFPPEYATAFQPIFDELDARVRKAATPHSLLRRTWARWGLMTFAADPGGAPKDIRERLMAAATEELGRMRSIFRRNEESKAVAEFDSLHEFYTVALNILFRFGTLWQGLKPLLLLLRALPVPATGRDLRPWHEPGLPAPPPVWYRIADDFAGYLHGFGQSEQLKDAQLDDLRANFANFCIERLKSRESTKPEYAAPGEQGRRVPTEDDPTWRRCYIRAIRELRINPWGRGHRVLFQCINNDPIGMVRDVARTAYGELRHNPQLGDGMSPRATVLAAHWWLRQAQRLSLLGENSVDVRGAQRTHDKETHRAKEVERAQLAPGSSVT